MQRLIQASTSSRRRRSAPCGASSSGWRGGQNPDTLFVTCSDSRIDPNLLTRSKPGDLFVLRNAGNIVPPHGAGGGEAATVEFAVSLLGVQGLTVCGHYRCGAMRALLRPETAAGLPDVAAWLRFAEATRRRSPPGCGGATCTCTAGPTGSRPGRCPPTTRRPVSSCRWTSTGTRPARRR